MAKKVCEKCNREMEDTNFYTYKNGEKFELCKSCLTMHVDNFDPESFLWILQKADVPYIPQEWNTLRDKAYAKNPQKMNGMSVIGKYLSKMKLKQWKNYAWADSEKLQEQRQRKDAIKLEQEQAQADRVRQQFENGEISQAQYRTLVNTQYQKQHQYVVPTLDPLGTNNMFNEKDFLSEDQLPDLSSQLTLEEKQQMALKWGRTYKISQWIQLQKKYTQMMNSFDIQDADSKNTLIFICKTYLKMNQAIDCGDVEGYQKLSRVYDALRKSAKFTAAQNKQEKTDFIDSVGQLVAYCEKYGGQIPRYEIKTPYDIVDKIIDDLKRYNRNLIYEDTALARQIQDYIKEAKAAAAARKDRIQAKEKGLDAPQLSDQDIIDFKNFVKQEKEQTQKIIGQEDKNELTVID